MTKRKVYRKRIGETIITYTRSSRKDKKWMTKTPSGTVVHWGHPTMEDFTQHRDIERRKAFRVRMKGITLANGKRAIDKKWSPAWLAYRVTW